MKKLIIPTLFLLSTTASLAMDGAESGETKSAASARYLQEITEANPTLAKAMDIDGVKVIYQSCFDHYHQGGAGQISGNKLMSCLWEGDDKAGIQGVAKQEELKKEVLAATEKDKSGKSEQSIRYQQSVKVQKDLDPGLKALQEHYKKKLEEALYGDRSGDKFKDKLIKSEKTVDQRVFFELHQSQLGKNVIAAVSSYCIEAELDANDAPMIDEDQKDTTRSNNLKKLHVTTNDNKSVEAKGDWDKCIMNIQHVCHQPNELVKVDKDGNKTGSITVFSRTSLMEACQDKQDPSLNPDQVDEICDKVVNYSQERACVVTQYITEARQNLDTIAKTIEGYDKLKITNRGPATVKFYNSAKDDKSIDDLTSITSGEAIESGYAQANKDDLAEIEKCLKDRDQELCAKFLNAEKDKSYAMLAELKLKQEAAAERLEAIADDDKEKIKELLLEEGYSEEDATQMASIDGIKAQIEEKYAAKKDAILRDMAKQIDSTTVTKDSLDLSDNSEDIAKLNKMKAELESKTQEFAELVHFNNIISGYLEIKGGEDEEAQRNTASIARELEGNAFTQENLKKAEDLNLTNRTKKSYDDYASVISKTGVELDPNASSGDETSKNLSVDQINDYLLNYFQKDRSQNP
jgi:hypothetical protein